MKTKAYFLTVTPSVVIAISKPNIFFRMFIKMLGFTIFDIEYNDETTQRPIWAILVCEWGKAFEEVKGKFKSKK
jgi:hypothetical protein